MDTNLLILTTGDHLLKPIEPGRYFPGELCVTLSRWGISNIGTIQPGFHVAYLRLADIQARPMASAPAGAKLLLYSRYGRWLIGTVRPDNRSHYTAWAPLPKVAPAVCRYQGVGRSVHPMVSAGVNIFAKMVEFASTKEQKLAAKNRLSVARTLLVDAVARSPGALVGLPALGMLIARPGEAPVHAVGRMADVLPYLTGPRGPYDLCFFYGGLEIELCVTDGKFLATAPDGTSLTEQDITMRCRRKDF